MPRNLWPAREERTADDGRNAAANRAHDKVRRCDVRQRAQDATGDQARDRQQRRPARNGKCRFASTKPRRETCEEPRRKMLCRLTPELSGGEAVRLNEELGACAAPCLGDCAGTTANPTKHNANSFGCLGRGQRCKGNCQVWRTERWRRLGRSTRCERTTQQGPNAGVKRRRSRPP
jgi:hypothetical protein